MGLNGSNKNHYLAPLIKTMGQRTTVANATKKKQKTVANACVNKQGVVGSHMQAEPVLFDASQATCYTAALT